MFMFSSYSLPLHQWLRKSSTPLDQNRELFEFSMGKQMILILPGL